MSKVDQFVLCYCDLQGWFERTLVLEPGSKFWELGTWTLSSIAFGHPAYFPSHCSATTLVALSSYPSFRLWLRVAETLATIFMVSRSTIALPASCHHFS